MQLPALSRYRIVAELGRGGMGVVYKAEDTRLGRTVALKFLPAEVAGDPVALERFRREARAASALNHPHICTIHDIDQEDGRYFIVMEALDGHTLADVVSTQRLKIDTVLDVSMQIAEALGAAHAKGIIHRDIKPSNIFLTEGGHAKVLDFGLAKLATDDESSGETQTMPPVSGGGANSPVTTPGQTLGTVAYMSPEQVRGEPLDARTDIFSFGATLYEMLTGRRPFTGATTGLISDAILNRKPQPLGELNPSVPPAMIHIIDKALEKDRDLRYQGMREMRADLARLKRDGHSSGAIAVPATKGRRGWKVAAAAAVILAAVGGPAYYFLSRPRALDPSTAPIRALTRITFDEGMQGQPAWSPDGKFLAYMSNQGGNVDIWVQPLAGGRAVRITSDPANDWQPDWSPDGNHLVFRSERDGGGIYMVPAFGGAERRLANFGYTPLWRPDGSSVLVVRKVPFFIGGGSLMQQAYLLSPTGAPPQRVLEAELAQFTGVAGMMWHPDGQRVTFYGRRVGERAVVQIWTVPVAGGNVVQLKASKEFDEQTASMELREMRWAPTGDALLLHASSRGVHNLWRVPVDPETLRYTSVPVRLTTGPGRDDELAVSRDGTRLAFVTAEEHTRLWAIPFDPATRRPTGEATPLPFTSVETGSFDLAADGTTLAYIGVRPGANHMQLWSASLAGGAPILLREALNLSQPRVSRNGDRVVFGMREAPGTPFTYPWMNIGAREQHVAQNGSPHDWSPDGRIVIGSCGGPPPSAICTTRIDDPTASRVRLIEDPGYQLWQSRYSPDGRWILFNAQDRKEASVSILGVAPAAGGAWRRLTAPGLWADKARWSPDGKTIYFVSNRESAFFDVWGIGFDPETGATVGEEFRVTRFTDPARRVLATSTSELGVSGDRIVVPIVERSGGVWVLDIDK